VEVEDTAAGERLRPGFEALGWVAERLVWMRLEGGPPAAGTPPLELAEVPFARTRDLRDAWFGDDDVFLRDADTRRHFLRVEEEVAARRGTRALAAFGPAGKPVGFAGFSLAGGDAEVEQLYVDPSRRGAGVGAALVRAAVTAARASRTWIVADDEGAPKRLYARLGFAPVWVQHVFTRAPA
jgi:GNAT superfamily N-acetyltransferase